jgi:hypothetical protein
MRPNLKICVALFVMISAVAACREGAENAGDAAPATDGWPSRLADGQPDVQGFWGIRRNSDDPSKPGTFASYTIEGGDTTFAGGSDRTLQLNIATAKYETVVVDPPGRIPYQEWALERRKTLRGENEGLYDPLARCVGGTPRQIYWGDFQIVQSRGTVAIIHEWNHFFRIIPVDGRPHAGQGLKLIMGDSVGHWEGNTLVVDVTNNSELPWFDTMGDFRSDALHVVERFTFSDRNTIQYEAVIEDPKTLTQPMKIAMTMMRNEEKGGDYELWEFACHENEKEVEHIMRAAEMRKRNRGTR